MACKGYDGVRVARSSGARPWYDGHARRTNCRSDRWFKYTEKLKDPNPRRGYLDCEPIRTTLYWVF
jgi:hypothetical protein